MLTDLKLIKEAHNYVIKFFNTRPKTKENYGCLLKALEEIIKSVEEEYLNVAQKIIDMGLDNPIYIKEQKVWIVPEVINNEIVKLMIVDRDEYKQLSKNSIGVIDDIMKPKDKKETKEIIKDLSDETIEDVNIDQYINNSDNKDCSKCKKNMSECGVCLTVKKE